MAIAQAASYVREVTRSFKTFLEDYHKHRKELHEWIPHGNRQYSYSLARTWNISFDFLKTQHPPTAKLLQYLSFLNSDQILIDFLQLTKSAVDEDVKQLVSDSLDFAKALLTLEKFSLIKWSRESQAISVHRLVQAVVKDGLSENDFEAFTTTVLEMCSIAFPSLDFHNETRSSHRRYQGQVLTPLLRYLQQKRTQWSFCNESPVSYSRTGSLGMARSWLQ